MAALLAVPSAVAAGRGAEAAPIVGPAAPAGDVLLPLRAWVDTLLPPDPPSPAASSLACDAMLRAKAARSAGYRRLLEAGCRWLEAEAAVRGGAFGRLPEPAREAIAGRAAAASPRSAPGAFFAVTREDVFAHYYTQPQSWAALGFDGPPQPEGFPDHAAPWRPARR